MTHKKNGEQTLLLGKQRSDRGHLLRLQNPKDNRSNTRSAYFDQLAFVLRVFSFKGREDSGPEKRLS